MEGEKRKNTQEHKAQITQTNPNITSTRVAYMRSTRLQDQSKDNITRVRFFSLGEVLHPKRIFSKRRA